MKKRNNIHLICVCWWLLFGMWMCSSCKSQQQPPVQIPVHTKEKIVERLVPYALPADSSQLTALFECDSLNNVRLKEIDELKAKGWNSKFSFVGGLFKYNMALPPDTVYIAAKDSIIERDVPIMYYIPSQPIIVYKQTDTQIVFGYLGKIFAGLLGLTSIIGIIVLVWKLKR